MPPSDAITLDNLSEKLPQWSPDDANQVYAIADMGSNGIRFSITSLEPPNTRLLLPLYSSRAAISLFDALQPSPTGPIFLPETITAVSSTLANFSNLAALYGVPASNILILATEAMRRATNAATMLNAIGRATDGLGVHILDPPVETLCGAVMGSRSGLAKVDGGGLFLDLGGGSVQMTWVNTSSERYDIEAALAGDSLPYGAAKLIRILEEPDQEVQLMETNKLENGLRQGYDKLCSQFPALRAIKEAYQRGEDAVVDVYMCGGGFRGYGSMLMHSDPIRPYPIPSIGSYSVDASRFKQTSKMRQLNHQHDGKIFGMSKRRRRQFPAIATVVEAFIAAVPNIGRVTFCVGSNREGALMMKLPRDVRESNPLDVLVGLTDAERLLFDAVIRKLSDALPKEVDFAGVPTILTLGLGRLFVREIWSRQGHDADTNSSFALRNAIIRDSDMPGLTHLARAVLALTGSARWGGSLGPADAQVSRGLRGILDSRSKDAFFWAQYLGAVSSVLATVHPVMPKEAGQLESSASFTSHIRARSGKRSSLVVKIDIASQNAGIINTEDIVDKLKAAAKDGEDKSPWKVSAQVSIIS